MQDLNAAITEIARRAVDERCQEILQAITRLLAMPSAPEELSAIAPAVIRPVTDNQIITNNQTIASAKRCRSTASELINYEPGQEVLYKQGRGEFKATILAIDYETGSLRLQRFDGVQVERSASTVRQLQRQTKPTTPAVPAEPKTTPAEACTGTQGSLTEIDGPNEYPPEMSPIAPNEIDDLLGPESSDETDS